MDLSSSTAKLIQTFNRRGIIVLFDSIFWNKLHISTITVNPQKKKSTLLSIS